MAKKKIASQRVQGISIKPIWPQSIVQKKRRIFEGVKSRRHEIAMIIVTGTTYLLGDYLQDGIVDGSLVLSMIESGVGL